MFERSFSRAKLWRLEKYCIHHTHNTPVYHLLLSVLYFTPPVHSSCTALTLFTPILPFIHLWVSFPVTFSGYHIHSVFLHSELSSSHTFLSRWPEIPPVGPFPFTMSHLLPSPFHPFFLQQLPLCTPTRLFFSIF